MVFIPWLLNSVIPFASLVVFLLISLEPLAILPILLVSILILLIVYSDDPTTLLFPEIKALKLLLAVIEVSMLAFVEFSNSIVPSIASFVPCKASFVPSRAAFWFGNNCNVFCRTAFVACNSARLVFNWAMVSGSVACAICDWILSIPAFTVDNWLLQLL